MNRYCLSCLICCECLCSIDMTWPEESTSEHLSLSSGSFLPSPLPWCSLSRQKRSWYRCTICGWALTVNSFQHFKQLTYLCINHIHYNKALLWLRLVASQIYAFKHKHLEGSLTTWSFIKTKSIITLLGFITSLAKGFNHIYSTRNEFPCGVCLKSNQESSWLPYKQSCCMQSPALDKMINVAGCFSSFVLCLFGFFGGSHHPSPK